MVARTDEKLTEGDSLLATASEQDKRGIYPSIHRDIAYAMASQSEDYAAATEHLRKYVDGHIAVHGGLPLDIDDVYDKMVLFGDNEWMPASAQKAGSAQTIQVSSEVGYHPTVWDSPADLAAYDAALQSSTQQMENSFGVVVADGLPLHQRFRHGRPVRRRQDGGDHRPALLLKVEAAYARSEASSSFC